MSRPIAHLYLGLPPDAGDGARWVEAIGTEAGLRARQGWRLRAPPRTLHLGGEGTLAGLAPGTLERVLEGLPGGAAVGELAVEARPSEIETGLLGRWLRAGVSRIALRAGPGGVVLRAATELARAGIPRWAVELEVGRGLAVGTARKLLGPTPPEISVVEGGDPDDPDGFAEEYLELGDLLRTRGYRLSCLTSFVREGHEGSGHFRAVRRGERYLGLGPGAHSFDGVRRIWNLSDAGAYISTVRRGRDPAAGRERPGAEARFLEWAWSRLRLAEGIDLSELPPGVREIRARWVDLGWAHADPRRLRLTRRGWLLLDTLVLELASTGPVDSGSERRRSSEAP